MVEGAMKVRVYNYPGIKIDQGELEREFIERFNRYTQQHNSCDIHSYFESLFIVLLV